MSSRFHLSPLVRLLLTAVVVGVSARPSERILPIYGYPLEVRVRRVDCSVIGSGGTEARFTAGTVEVGLRRLAAPNHRQSRVSDIATPKKPF